VNRYIEKQKVKFEGVNEAKQYAKQGNYAVKFDLKSGYHHIDIHPKADLLFFNKADTGS
jgi:hypothetical protein